MSITPFPYLTVGIAAVCLLLAIVGGVAFSRSRRRFDLLVDALEVVDVAPVAVVAPVVVAPVALDVVAMPLEVVDEVAEDDELDAPPFAVLALPPLHPNVATTVSAAPQSRARCMARFDARRVGSIHFTVDEKRCPARRTRDHRHLTLGLQQARPCVHG